MSLQKVLAEWIEYGLRPNESESLSPDNQRELVADICVEEPDTLSEAFGESFYRTPSLKTEFLNAYRAQDAIQVFAVVDRLLRSYLIGSKWLEYEIEWVYQRSTHFEED